MPELDRQALLQPGVVAGVEALPNDVLLRVQVPPSPRFGDPPNVWVCPWHFYHVQNYPKSYLSTISSTSRQYAYLIFMYISSLRSSKEPSLLRIF